MVDSNMKQDLGVLITPEVKYDDLSSSYWDAAESLFNEIINNHHSAKSRIEGVEKSLLSVANSKRMLPALFLYRHSIELLLKEALRLSEELNQPKVKLTHSIQSLYEDLLHQCEKCCDPDILTVLKSIGPLLRDLHLSDKRGTKYRYEDRDHEVYCVLKIKSDFMLVKEAVDKVKYNLSAIIDFQ